MSNVFSDNSRCFPVAIRSTPCAQLPNLKYDPLQLLDLSSLVDNSLLQQIRAEETIRLRYSMLETIGAFGRELAGRGEAALQTRMRHGFEDSPRAPSSHSTGPGEQIWRTRVESSEQGNIRAALDWSVQRAISKRDCALVERCGDSGRNAGAHRRAGVAFACAGSARRDFSRTAGQSRQALANMSFDLGDYAEAKARFSRVESLAIRRTLPDRSLVANALNGLGLVAFAQGNLAEAPETPSGESAAQQRSGESESALAILSNWADVEMALEIDGVSSPAGRVAGSPATR
ncbi:MAG: tetratricopeptide repeat protein [Thermomicrobiales bacterium]